MALRTSTKGDAAPRRRPLEYQRNIGNDMSMMCFVRSGSPRSFAHLDRQQIKGFNTEAVARVVFPRQAWLVSAEYRSLRSECHDNGSMDGSFSLNMSFYNREITSSEWETGWFFMYGRVHPYALTWEEDGQDYTIPVLMVRDQACQPFVKPIC